MFYIDEAVSNRPTAHRSSRPTHWELETIQTSTGVCFESRASSQDLIMYRKYTYV